MQMKIKINIKNLCYINIIYTIHKPNKLPNNIINL